MFRIIGQIYIACTEKALEVLVLSSAIPQYETMQMGLKRQVPEVDSWLYSSPYYRFHQEYLDKELTEFLESCHNLKNILIACQPEIEFAHLLLTPVQQSFEEMFSGILSLNTLQIIVNNGLSLEIAPATIMPKVPYWSDISLVSKL